MPRSRFKRQPLDLRKDTIAQRLARLRLKAEMLARFTLALGGSAGAIIGLQGSPATGKPKSRRIQRRLQPLQNRPKSDQEALLRTIEAFVAKAS